MRPSAVQKAVCGMGLSPRHKGFYYLSDALTAAMCADVNPHFGALYSLVDAEPANADRCMRYAIRYAWDVNNGAIHALFPGTGHPPSPVEFFNAMIWYFDSPEEPGAE